MQMCGCEPVHPGGRSPVQTGPALTHLLGVMKCGVLFCVGEGGGLVEQGVDVVEGVQEGEKDS